MFRQLPPDLVPSMVRGMWRGPRGRELARKAAFRELPFPELVRVPVLLGSVELTHELLFRDSFSAEQEAMLWQLGNDALDAYLAGKLGLPQAAQAALTWRGSTNLLGWKGLALTLEPRLRGPAAYLFGYRYLRLKRPDDAGMFFRSALADAPPGSPLARLASAELDRLKAK